MSLPPISAIPPGAGDVSPLFSEIEVKWPKAFVVLRHSNTFCTAMTADGVFVRMSIGSVDVEADLGFWKVQAQKFLEEKRLIKLSEARTVSLNDSSKAYSMDGSYGSKTYSLTLTSSVDYIACVEVWGPKDLFKKYQSQIAELLNNTAFDL